MRRFLAFFLPVAIACAAVDHENAIDKRMREHYDFTTLTAFTKKLIREHPTFENVSLASTKINSQWRIEKIDPPRRMRSGDWVIWEKKEEDQAFDLYYRFDATHSVTAHVRRLARDRFELLGLSIEEWVSLR